MKKNNLLNITDEYSYKPFRYPDAYNFYSVHEDLHWTKNEIELSSDAKDWNTKATEVDKFLITQILRTFTTNEVAVGSGYDTELRIFKPQEVKMMLRCFANRENVHIDAYANFTDTVGEFNEDTFYNEWRDYECMEQKLEFIHKAKVKHFHQYLDEVKAIHIAENLSDELIKSKANFKFRQDVARMLAVYGSGTEGILLFSQFAILMNYQRNGMFAGLSTTVEWSIRDENQHCEGHSWLFRTLIKENPDIWTDELKFDIYEAIREIVRLEDNFLDFAFSLGEIKGLTKAEMKQYIRYIADRRLLELGMKPNFKVKENPLPWMEEMINASSFSNFFDVKVTEYGKGTTEGTWEEASEVLLQFEQYIK